MRARLKMRLIQICSEMLKELSATIALVAETRIETRPVLFFSRFLKQTACVARVELVSTKGDRWSFYAVLYVSINTPASLTCNQQVLKKFGDHCLQKVIEHRALKRIEARLSI